MNPDEIFMEAVEIPAGNERREFIARRCPDAVCAAEVESLLNAHDNAGGFLIEPFVNLSKPATQLVSFSELTEKPGLRLGRYEVIRPLGVGGMGEVYLARDTQLQRDVAVKILSTVHTKDLDWLSRFDREAKAAGAINHPNILTVYEIGQSDKVHFIVAEFINGVTLRDRLTHQPMTIQEALETAVQTSNALVAAHSAHIVHRDLKPENIMIRSDGLVKVLDFGLARHFDIGDDEQTSPSHTDGGGTYRHISVPGHVMGTIHYMSPEQARGLPVDTRSDLFSFGVVLYEMLAGHQPFRGTTSSDVLVAILEREPPALIKHDQEIPLELSLIVRKLLRKHPDQRYQSANDLCQDLKQVQHSSLRGPQAGFGTTNTAPKHRIPGASTDSDPVPDVRYTCSGEVNIAYQVFGEGDIDLVFVMGWVSHLEWFWKEPSFARFLRQLGKFARVILFDKRGTGLSDRVPVDQLPTLEQRMDDVRAVMSALDSQRAVLCGISEGGPMCALFAATYPEKTIALIMIGSYARRLWADDYPWGVREEFRSHFFDEIRRNWGGPVGIEDRAPSLAFDPAFRQWWATYLRMGASPGAALTLTQMNAQIDIRQILPMIQVPTLVIHRTDDRCLKVEEGRYLADCIPKARFVELPGDDHLPFVGDQDSIMVAIERFLSTVDHAPGSRMVLATVLATTLSPPRPGDSTPPDLPDRLVRFRAQIVREVDLFRGANMTHSETGFVATFDGPTRAIRAAMGISGVAIRLGLKLQTGLHIGECDISDTSVSGSAVEFAQKISAVAEADKIVVSSTVKDLVAGSGIQFSEHPSGELQLGVNASRLFTVLR